MSIRSLTFLAAALAGVAAGATVHAQTVTYSPVQTQILERGKPQLLPFGEIRAHPFRDPRRPKDGAWVDGKFFFRAFGPNFEVRSRLDDWWDFRWVNVVISHKVDGMDVGSRFGTLPAIAPLPFDGRDPQRDNLPFFNTTADWGLENNPVHVERDFVRFRHTLREPAPLCPDPKKPCRLDVVVRSYLVATARGTQSLAGNHLCVITGFEWLYSQIYDPVTKFVSHFTEVDPSSLGQLDPKLGAVQINQALQNTRFKPHPAGAWTASGDCVLDYCPPGKKVGTLPSKGVREGWYVRAKERSGTSPGGLELVEPGANGQVIDVTGLPDEMTGKGALTGFGVGIASVAPANAEGNVLYIGTKTRGSEGGKFEKFALWEVEINSQGQTVQSKKLHESGPYKTPMRVGVLDVATIPEPKRPERRTRRCCTALDEEDCCDSVASPLGIYDPDTATFSRIPVTGNLPAGQAISIEVSASGEMLYVTFPQSSSSRTPIVTLPVEGGTPETLVTIPGIVQDIAVDPDNGTLHAIALPSSYFQIDPVARTFKKIATSRRLRENAITFEQATGDLILSSTTSMARMDAQGRVTTFRAVPFGQVTAISVNPSPVRYGTATSGDFAADWDLPARSATSGADHLPTAGNAKFAMSVSSGGWPLTGVVALAARRLPEPGLPFLNVTLHLDPLSIFAVLPVAGGKTIVVPLPIPPGIGRPSVYGQGFFLDSANLNVATRGLRVTVID